VSPYVCHRLWDAPISNGSLGVLLERKSKSSCSAEHCWWIKEATLFDHGFTETQRKNRMETARRFNCDDSICVPQRFQCTSPTSAQTNAKSGLGHHHRWDTRGAE